MAEPLINILNILSMCLLSATIGILVLIRIKKTNLYIGNLFFLTSFVLLLLVTFTNLLEHLSITDHFDVYEDPLELLFIPFMIFALYSTNVTYENKRRLEVEHLNSKILGTSPAITFIFNLEYEKFTFLRGKALLQTSERSIRESEADIVLRENLTDQTYRNIVSKIKNFKGSQPHNYPFMFEFDMKVGESTLRHFQAYNTIFNYDKNNNPAEIVGIAIDITEKQQAKEELVKYKNHLENLVKERTKELEASNNELIEINGQLQSTNEELRVLNEIAKRQSHKIEILNSNLVDQNQKLEKTNKELVKKQLELESALNKLAEVQEQLIHSEKLSSLGVLMAGIAHEINNPINYISNGLTGLKKSIKQVEYFTTEIFEKVDDKSCLKIRESFETNNIKGNLEAIGVISGHIQTGVNRILAIVSSLRQYTRSGEEDYESVDLNTIIDSVLVMLFHEYKHRIEVIKDYGKLPMVKCQPGKINQVFMNILSNAIQAIPDKGNIWVSSQHLVDKNVVQIDFKDDGPGIPATIKNKIFDPFYTTKEAGKGTGLGLSISYDIIQAHNGWIACKNSKDAGAVFTVFLPVRINANN